MYTLNKVLGCLISPVGFSVALVVMAVLARVLGRRRLAGWAVVLAFANLWVWSTPLMMRWIGASLEAEWLVDGKVLTVESLPQADLIELHGGSMGLATNIGMLAEMSMSADRVWHAARLWKAGKAPKILVTAPENDLPTSEFLADLGMPKEAIVYDLSPRNTEEEAKAVAVLCSTSTLNFASTRPKALVVTSAWHMKRTMLMYRKYAPNVESIPAPCDFENTLAVETKGWMSFFPDPGAFKLNSVAFHEWLGYFGYKYFR